MNIDGRTEHDVPCPNEDDIKIPSPFDVVGSECEWSKFRCRGRYNRLTCPSVPAF